MQTPPPPSEVVQIFWKMQNVLNRNKNHFSDFYFSSYGHFCGVITSIFNGNLKNKIRRFFLLFFPFRIFHKVSTTSEGRGGGGSAYP